ncbi:DUF4389 [Desulfonema limicola]|uniref:DUF4389 n=1 Tax=Desulfonema limicola TaxID=45656 RepID=A0A975B7T0_9BACT|nr:DUF4389 domain-containing protein [Desulfonema limicola]QTA80334.1 DUF4389 [Desulfonema limicola]
MNKVKQMLLKIMEIAKRFVIARKNIAVRFINVLFFTIAWKIVSVCIFFLTLFQFIYLFFTTKHSEAIKTLSHKLTVYSYKIMRYITLNENTKPYPFGRMPEEIEPAEETDLSTPVPEKNESPKPEPVKAEPVQDDKPAAKPLDDKKSEDDNDTQEAIILDHKS